MIRRRGREVLIFSTQVAGVYVSTYESKHRYAASSPRAVHSPTSTRVNPFLPSLIIISIIFLFFFLYSWSDVAWTPETPRNASPPNGNQISIRTTLLDSPAPNIHPIDDIEPLLRYLLLGCGFFFSPGDTSARRTVPTSQRKRKYARDKHACKYGRYIAVRTYVGPARRSRMRSSAA